MSSSGKSANASRGSRRAGLSALLAGMRAHRDVEWIRSGVHALDLILGDGIPLGRFVEVVGDPATAKSAYALCVVAAFQRAGGVAILLDTEAKTDRGFAERLGVDFGALGYGQAATLEDAVRLIGRVARTADPKVPTLIAWDSIAGTPMVDELDEAVSDDGIRPEKAARARYLSGALRAVLSELARRNVTLLGVNQLRTKMNFGTSFSALDSPGGRAVKYHASARLILRPRGKIRDRASDVVTGIVVEAEAIKNTLAPPFRRATLRFRFDSGFVPFTGLDELLLRHGRLRSAAGWLRFGSRKFRAAEIGQVAAELPALLEPIRGVQEEAPEAAVAEDDASAGDTSGAGHEADAEACARGPESAPEEA